MKSSWIFHQVNIMKDTNFVASLEHQWVFCIWHAKMMQPWAMSTLEPAFKVDIIWLGKSVIHTWKLETRHLLFYQLNSYLLPLTYQLIISTVLCWYASMFYPGTPTLLSLYLRPETIYRIICLLVPLLCWRYSNEFLWPRCHLSAIQCFRVSIRFLLHLFLLLSTTKHEQSWIYHLCTFKSMPPPPPPPPDISITGNGFIVSSNS